MVRQYRTLGRAAAAGALALATVLTGCADRRGGPIPYGVNDFGAPDPISAAALGADYRIAPLDILSIKVFKLGDLSADYEVDLTGQLSMPLIGNVAASDLTISQLDEVLTRRLGEKYLENPDVTISLKSSTMRTVTVDGAVNKVGSYPVLGPMTLMKAVALAGGTTADANARRVAIFRKIAGKRQAAAFDLTSIRRGEAPDPEVFAGDIVIIDGSSIKTVQRQVLNSLPILSIFKPF